MNIGIDKISFYVPHTYIDMQKLAHKRNIDPNKFTIGLGQDEMAIMPLTQDIVTLGANAAEKILTDDDREHIDLVILTTESGVDQSKAGATTIHRLLNINPKARSIEIKQACYSAAFAIHSALGHILMNPKAKVLIIASDVSRYGINTPGEPTQGAGAVAMVIAQDPKILAIEKDSTSYTDDVMDFWRPNYSSTAMVNGKFSGEQYQRFFDLTYYDYLEQTGRTLQDFDALLFHIPYTKQGLKALRSVTSEEENPLLYERFRQSTSYNRRVGNVYTASLFLSLISLLEKGDLTEGARLGLYSYGSGAVAEFFSGILQKDYKKYLVVNHEAMMAARTELTIAEYEAQFDITLPTDGTQHFYERGQDTGTFIFKGLDEHIRYYE